MNTEYLQASGLNFATLLLTHLDFDHAGGIEDFPEATIHLLDAEKKAALGCQGWISQRRYQPIQFLSHRDWKTYAAGGDRWFSFEAVRQLAGLPPEILLIPLIGHTLGHTGIAVQDNQGWLLHAGDAYFYHEEMNPEKPLCIPGLRAYQLLMDTTRSERRRNQRRLRKLIKDHGSEIRIFSAHDLKEFEQFQEPIVTKISAAA